jgi:Zn finger protein HypA/HybF involved in hydrogenase expression
MALPIQKTAVYTLTVPSTGKTVKYRPFLVKEQKSLLIAQQSEDTTVMLDTLKSLITDCIIDKIEIDQLAMFDIEFIFSQIRAKSVGETVDLILRCDTCEDEKAKVKVTVDLTKLVVETPEGHDRNIKLFDDVGVIMKYPSLDLIKQLENLSTEDVEAVFEVVVKSIDTIYAGEEVHYAKDYTKEEMNQFLDSLTQDQFKKIQSFFETMPSLEKRLDYKCPMCSKEQSVLVKGLDSFF